MSAEEDRLHVVEPTLTGEVGHCLSFTQALAQAAAGRPITVWAGRGAEVPRPPPWLTVERHFSRRLRKLQAPLLYRRLLAAPGRLLVSTAGRLDLLLLDWAAGGRPIPPGKAFLFFHWYRDTPSKRRALARAARRQPGLTLLAPTPSVVALFRGCGVQRAELVPYPITPAAAPAAGAAFRHLLFAGAPRQDKGFGRFVALLELLSREGPAWPVALQRAADPGRYEEATRRDLQRLDALAYPGLAALPDPLPAAGYAAQFAGAVCVQAYDAVDFADRVSGVTLDALSAGCPIVALEGTWSARAVARFGAGLVAADAAPATLRAAVQAVVADYPAFSERARAAGAALRDENDAGRLYRVVAGEAPASASR